MKGSGYALTSPAQLTDSAVFIRGATNPRLSVQTILDASRLMGAFAVAENGTIGVQRAGDGAIISGMYGDRTGPSSSTIGRWAVSGGASPTARISVNGSDWFFVGPNGNVSIFGSAGTGAPSNTGGVLYVQDNSGLSGNGGGVIFGSSQGFFAGIKGFVTNGTGPTGTLDVYARNLSTDPNLSLSMRIAPYGGSVPGLGLGGISPSALLELGVDSAKKPSTNTWTISSDERLKEKIVPADLDRCVEIIETLPLKRWAWPEAVYSSKRVRDRAKLGWTAQDVAKVFPKAVEPSEFALEPVEDGVEQVDEQVTAEEEREVVTVEIVNGVPTQKTRTEVVNVAQFDMVGIVDERGEPVMVDIEVESESGLADANGRPLTEKRRVQATHQVPRVRKVTRPKMRVDKIPDALAVNNDQVFMAMFGALQRALGRIKDLERDVAALKAASRR